MGAEHPDALTWANEINERLTAYLRPSSSRMARSPR